MFKACSKCCCLVVSLLLCRLIVIEAWLTNVISRNRPIPVCIKSSPHIHLDNSIVDAVAAHTRHKCQLLGVKSIGVDYGLVRTGVAVTVGFEPKALRILRTNNSTAKEIATIAKAEKASRIVLGLPLHKNGTIAEQTNLTIEFGEKLAEEVLRSMGPQVPVNLWDERYTSKEAAARVQSIDPYQNVQGSLDADAACIILESYYKANGIGAETMRLSEDRRLEMTLIYEATLDQEKDMLQRMIEERDRKQQARKDAIAKSQQQLVPTTGKKKRKKKKKR